MTDEKLKNCPFCGEKVTSETNLLGVDKFWITCCCGAELCAQSSKEEVIAAWNRRDGASQKTVLTMEDIKRAKKLCEENISTHQESMQDLEKLIDLHKEAQNKSLNELTKIDKEINGIGTEIKNVTNFSCVKCGKPAHLPNNLFGLKIESRTPICEDCQLLAKDPEDNSPKNPVDVWDPQPTHWQPLPLPPPPEEEIKKEPKIKLWSVWDAKNDKTYGAKRHFVIVHLKYGDVGYWPINHPGIIYRKIDNFLEEFYCRSDLIMKAPVIRSFAKNDYKLSDFYIEFDDFVRGQLASSCQSIWPASLSSMIVVPKDKK